MKLNNRRFGKRCHGADRPDRVRLTEINADLAVAGGAFDRVSRARNRLERFRDSLVTEPGQPPLPFPKARSRPNSREAAEWHREREAATAVSI